ncbi:hypothetical protein TIFTF001_056740, partial [Ficus carica]
MGGLSPASAGKLLASGKGS